MVFAALNHYCKGRPKAGSNKVIGNLIIVSQEDKLN